MAQSWDISGDDIVQWAATLDAAADLPDLVRRLLLATESLRHLEMRADGGVRLAGWDGVVQGVGGSAFCPAGLSVWELSVRADVKAKLDGDYAARLEQSALDRSRTTYVAVTGRRYAGKQAWVDAKTANTPWQALRVLDADDLSAWLAEAPAVARWFATRLGRPVADLADFDSFLRTWGQRTRPPLPAKLLLTGAERTRAADDLRGWAGLRDAEQVRNGASTSSALRVLTIGADTRDEAVAFVAAALADTSAASRGLVASSPEALRWASLSRSARPPLLVAAFRAPLPPLEGTIDLLLVSEEAPAPGRQGVWLGEIPYRRIEDVLAAAGLIASEAARVARESGGKLSALQRLMGYHAAPAWAEDVPAEAVATLLVLGAWDPLDEADRAVVSEMGIDPRELERLCESLSRPPDAATVRESEHWRRAVWTWRAGRDVWGQLAGRIPAEILRRFEETAVRVLSQPDPRFELDAEERYLAPLHGKVLQGSSALRQGMASALAELALRDAELEALHGPRAGSGVAGRVVRSVLRQSWQAWASVSELLPVLAEAAPRAFLGALDRSLDTEDTGAAHLLAEEGNWSSPHTGLLWALETLAWEPRHLPRVALCLAKLAAFDRKLEEQPGRLANRPASSLLHVLHPAAPMTLASADDRLRVLATVLDREPEAGFDLLLGILDDGLSMVTLSPQPKFRRWRVLSFEDIVERNRAEVHRVGLACLRHAAERAGVDPARWAKLVGLTLRLPEQWSTELLDALEGAQSSFEDPGLVVWAAIRKRLHRDAVSAKGPHHPALHTRLRKVYAQFEPADPVCRVAWLFTTEARHLPEPLRSDVERDGISTSWWEVERQAIDEARGRALAALWHAEEGLALLERLAPLADACPLGLALGHAPFAEEAEVELLAGAARPALQGVIPWFVVARFEERGRDVAWLEHTVRGLAADGRAEDVTAAALCLDPEPGLWDLLTSLGEQVAEDYWRRLLTRVGRTPSPRDVERATGEMLRVGNVLGALRASAGANGELSSASALAILDALARAPDVATSPAADQVPAHRVAALFKVLDGDPNIDPERMVALELRFLRVLEQSERPARHLWQRLGENSEFFVELVCLRFPLDDDVREAGEGDSEEQRRVVARSAYRILEAWKGFPGEELAPDEREQRLDDWATAVLRLAEERGRGPGAIRELAGVLARAPSGPDGHWPCVAARRQVEAGLGTFAQDLRIAKRNLRGVRTSGVFEGGQQEWVLASRYRASAVALRIDYPRTAALLDELAEAYEREAEREDEEARTSLRRAGLEPQAVGAGESAGGGPSGREPRGATEPAGGDEGEGDMAEPARALAEPWRVSRLRVRGLRCLKAVDLDLGDLTVLIGDNGTGKSSVIEACQLLHAAAGDGFLETVETVHGTLRSLLGAGASSLGLGLRAQSGDIELDFDLELALKGTGTKIVAEKLSVTRGGEALPGRRATVVLERTETSVRLVDASGTAESIPGLSARRLALHTTGRSAPHPGLAWAREVLAGIDVHVAFPIRASWVSAERRESNLRVAGPLRPARRLERSAGNLSQAWYVLRHELAPGHWETTLDHLRLGLGEQVEDVRFPDAVRQSDATLALKYRQWDRPVPLSGLSDGTLAFLAFVALLRLHEGRTLLVFDEPELHLHPALLLRVLDFFEAMAEDHPVLLATHSDRILDGLSHPAEAAVLCALDESGRTELRRADREVLDRWLERYRGLGDLRAEGHEASIMTHLPGTTGDEP